MMMMPGLTEEECQRYQELLEIKCQYERHHEKQKREEATNEGDDAEAEMKEQRERKEAEKDGEEESPFSSSVVDMNSNTTLSVQYLAVRLHQREPMHECNAVHREGTV